MKQLTQHYFYLSYEEVLEAFTNYLQYKKVIPVHPVTAYLDLTATTGEGGNVCIAIKQEQV